MNHDRTILVAGGTGYVGGRLVARLLEAGYAVRVLARAPSRARQFDWSTEVELVIGDVLDRDSLDAAFDGCWAAFYLVHSMGSADDFEETDALAAANFRDAADAAGIARMVYLGGMGGDDDELSAHLASRHRVGEILASGSTPTTELRAAVIIGSGSLSFEMLRYLTEVLPIMTTPTWVRTRCQPIAIRDVLHYLVAVLDDEPVDRVLEIGGPDVLSYEEMMQTFARAAGLRRRIIVPVPVLSPGLSSRWVGLVTPLPSAIARPLIDSLRHEVVMHDHTIDELVPHEPIPFRRAVELALRRTRTEAVETRWTDAGYTAADTLPGDPEWSGGAWFTDHQTVDTTAPRRGLYEAFARIGGANGYYVANWAWRLRGLLDRLTGGPGLRRGRRHPVDLRPGESLDFWRVTSVERDRALVLHAEMRVPGRAWLSWSIEELDADTRRLHQTAHFAPRGLWGRVYWYAMLPFHFVIFAGMARSIVRHAESATSTAERVA
jgi:uncharacterized protein YbjT (DUF2867 family)